MARVRIITDAGAQLDPSIIARYNIEVLPLNITFGDQEFQIVSDADDQEFYKYMGDNEAQAIQASISPQALRQAFRRVCEGASDILVLPSSSKLSHGYRRAQEVASAFLGRCRIMVIDSMTASWGLGFMVEEAAKAADKGQALDDIVRLVRGILPHIYLVFFVERLDYLEQGKRIGPAQALLGTMLRIIPLLLVEDGDIIPLEKVRTQSMAVEKLADFVSEFASIQRVVILSSPVQNARNELINALAEQLNLSLPDQGFEIMRYDPVLACHLGPEALGVIVYEGF